jgi:hypothetical protein
MRIPDGTINIKKPSPGAGSGGSGAGSGTGTGPSGRVSIGTIGQSIAIAGGVAGASGATPDTTGNGDGGLEFNPNIGAKIQNNIGGDK